MILAALHRCGAFKEAVTSSRLHGLTLVWKDLNLQVGACLTLGLLVQGGKRRIGRWG